MLHNCVKSPKQVCTRLHVFVCMAACVAYWSSTVRVCVCVGASVNIILSLDDGNWLHLKAIAFLDMHSVGQDPRAIYYIRLKYVQSAD